METESYAKSFQSEEAVQKYEKIIYSDDSYDSFIWNIESHKVVSIFRARARHSDEIVNLDYACGTGRIISLLEKFTKESSGIDVSEQMISVARGKVSKAKLVVGDISENEEILEPRYDIITLFRYVLNAEPASRKIILSHLAARLDSESGRLIFNGQGNKHSLRHVTLQFCPNSNERINEMSYGKTRKLIESCGLEIISWYGFGVLLPFLHSSWICTTS